MGEVKKEVKKEVAVKIVVGEGEDEWQEVDKQPAPSLKSKTTGTRTRQMIT